MSDRFKIIAAWCLYDWALTPFSTIVMTFVISNYYAKAIAVDPTRGSADWSFMVALAGIAIAVLSPPLGAIADRTGRAKLGIAMGGAVPMLVGFALWFARPDPANARPVLWLVGVGIVAFELSILFYSALLPSVAGPRLLGRVSGWGWAMGYFGGLACLAAALGLFVMPERPAFGVGRDAAANIRACGPLVALWFAAFAWPLFLLVPDRAGSGESVGAALREGWSELRGTVALLWALPELTRFLIASAIYRDAVTTILAVGGLYAGGTFGLGFTELILFGIGLNVTAGLGATAFAWLDDGLGSRRTILLALAGLIACGAAIVLVRDRVWFFGFALALGLFIGPSNSASRSMILRLSPPAEIARFFGLYNLTGRAVSFVGPALFGWVTQAAGSQRAGLGVILLMLVLGLALLARVREPQTAGRV